MTPLLMLFLLHFLFNSNRTWNVFFRREATSVKYFDRTSVRMWECMYVRNKTELNRLLSIVNFSELLLFLYYPFRQSIEFQVTHHVFAMQIWRQKKIHTTTHFGMPRIWLWREKWPHGMPTSQPAIQPVNIISFP